MRAHQAWPWLRHVRRVATWGTLAACGGLPEISSPPSAQQSVLQTQPDAAVSDTSPSIQAPRLETLTVTATGLYPWASRTPLRLQVNNNENQIVEISDSTPQIVPWGKSAGETVVFTILNHPFAHACAQPEKMNAVLSDGLYRISCDRALRLADKASAKFVIGQADMNSNNKLSPPSNASLLNPAFPPVFTPDENTLYLADSENHRILRFSMSGETPPSAADECIGQSSCNAGSSTQLNRPLGLAINNATLAIGDYNGISIYSAQSNGTNWSLSETFNRSSAGATCALDNISSNGSYPSVIFFSGGAAASDRLWHRVLFWDTLLDFRAGISPARFAYGLGPDNSNCSLPALSAVTLFSPSHLYNDAQYFYITDFGANRILIFEGPPTSSNDVPIAILGQATRTSFDRGISAQSMALPYSVVSDAKTTWVADAGNNRVMAFNRNSMVDNASAQYCIGQVSCDGQVSQNQGSSHPTSSTLAFPSGVAIWRFYLVVTDTLNHRVLFYESQS